MAATIEVKYFNSFLLRKTVDTDSSNTAAYKPTNTDESKNWLIEESRIKGGFNEASVDLGVRAFLVADNNKGSIRRSGLIHSGVFNSRTGINYTNQFPVGEEITRSLDPDKGSVQKLYAEDTNLIILQEAKASKALINKDAVYSAEGQALTTSTNLVIGQVVPFAGEYGISTDPGSFAIYGYRKYFTDKNKNAVIRLSMDGITEISSYGMRDYFRDKMSSLDLKDSQKGEIEGAWDIHTKSYVLTLKPWNDEGDVTLAFDEKVKGWVSFYTYIPDNAISLKNSFYSVKNNKLYKHYSGDINTFYDESSLSCSGSVTSDVDNSNTISIDQISAGKIIYVGMKVFINSSLIGSVTSITAQQNQTATFTINNAVYLTNSDVLSFKTFSESSVTFVFNARPSTSKTFQTISYEGSNGWKISSLVSGIQGADVNRHDSSSQSSESFSDRARPISSYAEGAYIVNNNQIVTPSGSTWFELYSNGGTVYRSGFNRKENKYVSSIRNNSAARPGEVSWGQNVSGIKGFIATVKIATDSTSLNNKKELYAVSTNVSMN